MPVIVLTINAYFKEIEWPLFDEINWHWMHVGSGKSPSCCRNAGSVDVKPTGHPSVISIW